MSRILLRRRDAPVRLGVISDLHCGSKFGLTPPRWWPRGGGAALPQTTIMRYLWRCWMAFVAACPPLDALLVNGDLIEGEASRRDALDAITDDVLVHQRCAEETLRMIRRKTRRLIIVRGTPAHEGKFFEAVEAAARALGAEPLAGGYRTADEVTLEIAGYLVHATHHMTRGAIYRGTLADRTALLAAAVEGLGKAPKADLIIRSHLHMAYVGESYGRWVMLTPAWKVVTPWARRTLEHYRALALSDLGAYVVEIDARGLRFRRYSYPPPKITPYVVHL